MFHVGQKVVCVDGAPDLSGLTLLGTWDASKLPTKGQIYTITQVGIFHVWDSQKRPCVHVSEIVRPPDQPVWAHRFRPVAERKTDISVFTEMLTPAPKRVKKIAALTTSQRGEK